MPDEAIFFILVPLIGAVAVGAIIWNFRRSRTILEQWAADGGYELLHSQGRAFFRGPMFWTTSKGQTVYYVTVRDPAGRIRRGYVRCGSWWWGLWSDQAEVRWDDEG